MDAHTGDLDDDALSALVHEDTLRQLAGASAESSGLTCLKHALDGFCVVFNRGACQMLSKERADRMTDKRLELTLAVFLKDLGRKVVVVDQATGVVSTVQAMPMCGWYTLLRPRFGVHLQRIARAAARMSSEPRLRSIEEREKRNAIRCIYGDPHAATLLDLAILQALARIAFTDVIIEAHSPGGRMWVRPRSGAAAAAPPPVRSEVAARPWVVPMQYVEDVAIASLSVSTTVRLAEVDERHADEPAWGAGRTIEYVLLQCRAKPSTPALYLVHFLGHVEELDEWMPREGIESMRGGREALAAYEAVDLAAFSPNPTVFDGLLGARPEGVELQSLPCPRHAPGRKWDSEAGDMRFTRCVCGSDAVLRARLEEHQDYLDALAAEQAATRAAGAQQNF